MSTVPRPTSRQTRRTAAPKGRERDEAREALSTMLRQLGDHSTPSSGDRVRFVYPDGTRLEGVWTFTGDTGESGPFAVRDDEGRLHLPRPGHVRCDIAKDRVALLTVGEVLTIATLLDEFAAMCPGHPLEDVAREHVRSINDRFLFARDSRLPAALPDLPAARLEPPAPLDR
ncbi:hypothetical protein [Kineococcus xinjiangensis]|uniref:hypothetical protein n=1 Tax=Kineococcus xinjiangensis TaxID=512762 RepID=UPI0011B04EA7|nr:hypothetical protein [Kineococcus xinjiangensis]